MTKLKSYREASKADWATELQIPTTEQIQLGALLRMADALDQMKRPFTDLLRDRERYERYYREGMEREKRMLRQIAALRGHLKRMKKK